VALAQEEPELEEAAPDDELVEGEYWAEDEYDDEEVDLGPWLGLALVFALGVVVGGATSIGLWVCYPPTRATWWRIPIIMSVSVGLLLTLFGSLRRTAGRQASDWFVLGYLGALMLYVGLLGLQASVQFVRDHVASSIGSSV
jgi:hypothetical protein